MANEGKAFVKGGLGCLVAFIVLALLAVLLGGSAHMDLGGLILLLVIGGVIGLIVNWIYQKGKNDAG
jgi:membrane protease YdiL (CAAX protease family)